MRSIFAVIGFSLLSLCSSMAAEPGVRFINSMGEHRIEGTKETVKITQQGDKVQFRLRDVAIGPAEPVIKQGSDWFIAIEDQDHIWVHLGGGRIFYYRWKAPNKTEVYEWTYPEPGVAKIPPAIEARLPKGKKAPAK